MDFADWPRAEGVQRPDPWKQRARGRSGSAPYDRKSCAGYLAGNRTVTIVPGSPASGRMS